MEQEEIICKECQNAFTLDQRDLDFFTDKGFDLPKRCLECRKRRRKDKREAEIVPPTPENPS